MSILTFHSVEKKLLPGITNYHPTRFERLLKNLKSEKYNFVALNEYLTASDKSELVSLTFDDGYESFYFNVLPILEKYQVPAAVFIPFSFIGKTAKWDYLYYFTKMKHLSEKQLSELKNYNIEIGSHGLTHINLTGLSPRLLEVELKQSKKGLEEIIDGNVNYVGYPFGKFNESVENCSAEIGYRNGFALSYINKNKCHFTYPRFAVYSIDTTYSVMKKLEHGAGSYLEKIKGSIINAYAGGTVVLNKIRSRNNS
jgi:peptidoglycan/xylan/chitin deacetylase (PgdA/CDA1 family)